MDPPKSLLPHLSSSGDRMKKSVRRTNTFRMYIATAVLFCLFGLGRLSKYSHVSREADRKVPLEIHIMSKCPDARDCIQQLILPTMANASDKIDFKLSFIGKESEADDGVQCMHGETECLGNILMLCAAAEYPDPERYLGFSNCLIDKYREIPSQSLAEDCALEHGLDFGVLNDCMSRDMGDYGMGLLKDSVQHSQSVGAGISCTVRLDSKVRCIFDGGEAKECPGGSRPEDLVSDVERLYHEAQR